MGIFGEHPSITHLASADEHRVHFSLHNINSAKAKGEQYFLPGVHSDIGGGYLDAGSDANLIVFQGRLEEAARDRDEYLLAQGWFKKEQLADECLQNDLSEGYDITRRTIRLGEDGDPWKRIMISVQQRVKKKNEMPPNEKPRIVRNAYCKIPLKLMAEAAVKSGITFKSKLNRDATKTLKPFTELANLESRIRAHIAQAGPHGSKPGDWQKIEPKLNAIRHKHLHFSARYNGMLNGMGQTPRLKGGKRKRYEFNG